MSVQWAGVMQARCLALLWYIYIHSTGSECTVGWCNAGKMSCIALVYIIESVDSISKDERGFPLTQYITNGRIYRGGYTFTHFKHHHRVLRLISYRMSV